MIDFSENLPNTIKIKVDYFLYQINKIFFSKLGILSIISMLMFDNENEIYERILAREKEYFYREQ
jgi:hypothetical protein